MFCLWRCFNNNNDEATLYWYQYLYFIWYWDNNISRADPKIQDVRGYWGECEDKGISEQTVIQTRKIFSANIWINIHFANIFLNQHFFLNVRFACFELSCSEVTWLTVFPNTYFTLWQRPFHFSLLRVWLSINIKQAPRGHIDRFLN